MWCGHIALRYCLCAWNGHQCDEFDDAIVRVISCLTLSPLLM